MAHRVGEGRLFPPQDTLGEPVSFKSFAQEIFAHAVFVQLFLRIDGHDILHKVQVAEGHPGLQGVHRDAPVRPEHIVHMQLPEPLLRLLLEGPGVGGVVGVLVAEQLIGDLPGEDHPDIRPLMDGLAYQVHPNAGPDGGDVIGAQQLHHRLQAVQHVLAGDDDLRVVAADVIRHLAGVFQVDGVGVHADGEGADRGTAPPGGDGAHQGGVQPAGQEKAHLGVGDQSLLHSGDELFPDVGADSVHAVPADALHLGNVPVAHKSAILIVVPWREGGNCFRNAYKILRLAGKNDGSNVVISVV